MNIYPAYSIEEWKGFWIQAGGGEVIWAQDTDGSAVQAYRVRALGTTVIVDRQGRVTYRDEGATSYGTLRQAIQKVL